MSSRLERVALFAEIVAAFAVVISVVYLASEVSEGNTQAEIANSLSLYERGEAVRRIVLQDPTLLDVVRRGGADLSSLTELERARYELHAMNLLDVWELAYGMQLRGQISERSWAGWDRASCAFLSTPGTRTLLPELSPYFDPGFFAHAEGCIGG
jgi:hypothetical protein